MNSTFERIREDLRILAESILNACPKADQVEFDGDLPKYVGAMFRRQRLEVTMLQERVEFATRQLDECRILLGLHHKSPRACQICRDFYEKLERETGIKPEELRE